MADETTVKSTQLKTYYGNCHCGAFKFHLVIPKLKEIFECNCSICFKKNYKWILPKENTFFIDKGEGVLKDYQFGKKAVKHQFCPNCGTGIYEERNGKITGVNARALQDVNMFALKVISWEGRSSGPKYMPPEFAGTEPTAIVESPKLYTGSCHCGAVTLCLKSKSPLPTSGQDFLECDCSICTKSGTVLTYPRPDQVSITNKERLSTYIFRRGWNHWKFCSTCGITVHGEKQEISSEEWKKWRGDAAYPGKRFESTMVNSRILEGIE